MVRFEDARIAVLGLGYVGLPLAVAFGTTRETVGFDINQERLDQLRAGVDRTLEVDSCELADALKLKFSNDIADLKTCSFFIVTVPTPIDSQKRPDLTALRAASKTVGQALTKGAVVVYESTVYPGATEEDCVPILEQESGLKVNADFFVGYSPERANPGDREHRLATIVKVTSGSTPEAAALVDRLYREVVPAGTHLAPSIRVAEAAKVIENTQRDLNIALVNELAIIFNRLGVDTDAVLAAAGTKWNFLPFRPGLVGGHCIGVDPYYLTYKAEAAGYNPEVILSGRRINESMGRYAAGQLVKTMIRGGLGIKNARILVLGLTFKENCPDLRNTRVVDLIAELQTYDTVVDVHDPWIDPTEAHEEYNISVIPSPQPAGYDAVILAVSHREFRELGAKGVRGFLKPGGILYDLKSVFAQEDSDLRL